MNKVVNFPALHFNYLKGGWPQMYINLFKAFHELGYEIRLSPHIQSNQYHPEVSKSRSIGGLVLPDYVKIGIVDNPEHIYVYNHTTAYDINKKGWFVGRKNLIIKPSGPGSQHFTIDDVGYASHSSITYKEPNYLRKYINDEVEPFYETKVKEWINGKINKWDEDWEVNDFSEPKVDIPNEHVLFIGQMPGDETCTKFSFGDHWTKFVSLINSIQTQYNIIIKLHPYLLQEKNLHWTDQQGIKEKISEWEGKGYTVLSGFESLHNILPKTRVAVIENSTSGLECLMHNVPIISYGYPEYHWVTKDLRHAINLSEYVADLSWYDKDKAQAWLTWYSENYACEDKDSTLSRLKELI